MVSKNNLDLCEVFITVYVLRANAVAVFALQRSSVVRIRSFQLSLSGIEDGINLLNNTIARQNVNLNRIGLIESKGR
jgi:hypothetical protein